MRMCSFWRKSHAFLTVLKTWTTSWPAWVNNISRTPAQYNYLFRKQDSMWLHQWLSPHQNNLINGCFHLYLLQKEEVWGSFVGLAHTKLPTSPAFIWDVTSSVRCYKMRVEIKGPWIILIHIKNGNLNEVTYSSIIINWKGKKIKHKYPRWHALAKATARCAVYLSFLPLPLPSSVTNRTKSHVINRMKAYSLSALHQKFPW